MENQPLLVLLRQLRLASSPPCHFPCPVRPAGRRDSVCLLLDLVVRCSFAGGAVFRVLASWGPLLVPCLLCAPATEILSSFLEIFRGSSRGISSSHCWSLLNWRHLSVFRPASAGDRSLSGLLTGDCGLPQLRIGHVRVWVVACLPLLQELAGCGNSCTLDALCIDRNCFPVSPGLF